KRESMAVVKLGRPPPPSTRQPSATSLPSIPATAARTRGRSTPSSPTCHLPVLSIDPRPCLGTYVAHDRAVILWVSRINPGPRLSRGVSDERFLPRYREKLAASLG